MQDLRGQTDGPCPRKPTSRPLDCRSLDLDRISFERADRVLSASADRVLSAPVGAAFGVLSDCSTGRQNNCRCHNTAQQTAAIWWWRKDRSSRHTDGNICSNSLHASVCRAQYVRLTVSDYRARQVRLRASSSDRRMPCSAAEETVIRGHIPAPNRPNRRWPPAPETAIKWALDRSHDRPLDLIPCHDNEEASQASLVTRRIRGLGHRSAIANASEAAITPSNFVSFVTPYWPRTLPGQIAACLRAGTGDSGGLRGEARRRCFDDACLSDYGRVVVGT